MTGRWRRLGRLPLDTSRASWAATHASLPVVLEEGRGSWSVYLSLRDSEGRARIGRTRLALDPEILAGSQPFRVDDVASADGRVALASGGLGDLRLFDSGGHEVQYLLIAPQLAFTWRNGRILKVKETRQTSGFEVDLGSPTAVDRLRVNGLPAPFLKRVRLEGPPAAPPAPGYGGTTNENAAPPTRRPALPLPEASSALASSKRQRARVDERG